MTTKKLNYVSDIDVGDTKKLTTQQMMSASKKALSKHIEDITQTQICVDNDYCKKLIDIWMKKHNG